MSKALEFITAIVLTGVVDEFDERSVGAISMVELAKRVQKIEGTNLALDPDEEI